MYSFHESSIPFSSTITLPNTPFRQFHPMISCLFHLFCYSKTFTLMLRIIKSLAHFFCFFSFAEKITLFPFCRLFLYSFHALPSFPLLLKQPSHSTTMFCYVCIDLLIIHMSCTVYIIIFFICCQCSFTSRCFHSASSTLSLTINLYSSHVISSLSFHTCHLFVVLNHMPITNNLCFDAHSSFGMTLMLRTLALSPSCTII